MHASVLLDLPVSLLGVVGLPDLTEWRGPALTAGGTVALLTGVAVFLRLGWSIADAGDFGLLRVWPSVSPSGGVFKAVAAVTGYIALLLFLRWLLAALTPSVAAYGDLLHVVEPWMISSVLQLGPVFFLTWAAWKLYSHETFFEWRGVGFHLGEVLLGLLWGALPALCFVTLGLFTGKLSAADLPLTPGAGATPLGVALLLEAAFSVVMLQGFFLRVAADAIGFGKAAVLVAFLILLGEWWASQPEWTALPVFFAAGLLQSYLYRLSRSLLLPIVYVAGWNFFLVSFLGFPVMTANPGGAGGMLSAAPPWVSSYVGWEPAGYAVALFAFAVSLGLVYLFKHLRASPVAPDAERPRRLGALGERLADPRERDLSFRGRTLELLEFVSILPLVCLLASAAAVAFIGGDWMSRLPTSLAYGLLLTYAVFCLQIFRFLQPVMMRDQRRLALAVFILTLLVLLFLVRLLSRAAVGVEDFWLDFYQAHGRLGVLPYALKVGLMLIPLIALISALASRNTAGSFRISGWVYAAQLVLALFLPAVVCMCVLLFLAVFSRLIIRLLIVSYRERVSAVYRGSADYRETMMEFDGYFTELRARLRIVWFAWLAAFALAWFLLGGDWLLRGTSALAYSLGAALIVFSYQTYRFISPTMNDARERGVMLGAALLLPLVVAGLQLLAGLPIRALENVLVYVYGTQAPVEPGVMLTKGGLVIVLILITVLLEVFYISSTEEFSLSIPTNLLILLAALFMSPAVTSVGLLLIIIFAASFAAVSVSFVRRRRRPAWASR